MSAPETTTTEVPKWLAEMRFCHLFPVTTRGMNPRPAWCGHTSTDTTTINGPQHRCSDKLAAICDGCGQPRCPRCAQLSLLNRAAKS